MRELLLSTGPFSRLDILRFTRKLSTLAKTLQTLAVFHQLNVFGTISFVDASLLVQELSQLFRQTAEFRREGCDEPRVVRLLRLR